MKLRTGTPDDLENVMTIMDNYQAESSRQDLMQVKEKSVSPHRLDRKSTPTARANSSRRQA